MVINEEIEIEPTPEVETEAVSVKEEQELTLAPLDTPALRRREGNQDNINAMVCFSLGFSGKRKASFVEGIESPREKKRARDDSEPADEDGMTHLCAPT